MIDQDYKKFECIKKLGNYRERFIHIVDIYGNRLENRIQINGSIYTMHNFNNHCIDIYKIISEVLLNSKTAYTGKQGLTKKELYILDLAVLFHDFSMSQDIMTERINHSRKSAEMVQKFYDEGDSALHTESGLSVNEINALKAIIMAHSDVKDGSVLPGHYGLNAPGLSDEMPAKQGHIRARFLAGILRFADELDVTSERLGNTNIEDNLKEVKRIYTDMKMQKESGEGENSEEQLQKYKKYVESLTHWENLHLFSQVYRESQDDTIYLVTDDEHLQHLMEAGHSAASLTRRILNVYEKIMKEWKAIKGVIVDGSPHKLDIKSIFPVTSIKINCAVEEIVKELDKHLNNIGKLKANETDGLTISDSFEKPDEKDSKDVNAAKRVMQNVSLVDEDLSTRLKIEINRRHLLKVGHFLLDDEFCARDWIDTKEIVETKVIADEIVGCFIEHIRHNCDLNGKFLVVGLDLEGALLASRIAMGLKMPFSYIIPVKERPNSSSKESEISIDEYDGIILISDAIVAFDTIKKALDEIKENVGITMEELLNKVTRIYSIFYRESPLLVQDNDEELKKKTFCGNMDFPVELFRKDECHYMKEGKCFALNKRLKGEIK